MKPNLDPATVEWLEREHADLVALRRRISARASCERSPRTRATRFVVSAFVVAVFTLLCLALAVSNLPGATP